MEKALNHWSGRQPHPALLGGMLAVLRSAALVGVEAVPVEVEVNTGEQGELRIEIVGLPDTAVKESEDRVLSAMMNTGLRTHETKTTVNLAPGDLRKEGAMYDLPIAVGMAAATGQISKGWNAPARALSLALSNGWGPYRARGSPLCSTVICY